MAYVLKDYLSICDVYLTADLFLDHLKTPYKMYVI
jgi:hypothetical protein